MAADSQFFFCYSVAVPHAALRVRPRPRSASLTQPVSLLSLFSSACRVRSARSPRAPSCLRRSSPAPSPKWFGFSAPIYFAVPLCACIALASLLPLVASFAGLWHVACPCTVAVTCLPLMAPPAACSSARALERPACWLSDLSRAVSTQLTILSPGTINTVTSWAYGISGRLRKVRSRSRLSLALWLRACVIDAGRLCLLGASLPFFAAVRALGCVRVHQNSSHIAVALPRQLSLRCVRYLQIADALDSTEAQRERAKQVTSSARSACRPAD